MQTSEGHDKSVSSVAWYPEDANAFFSASFDGTVKVWDASRVEVVVRFGGETDDELVRAKSETRTVSTFLSLIVVKAM